MRDLNFFSGFIKEKRNKNKSVTIMTMVAMIAVAICIGSVGYVHIMIGKVQREVDLKTQKLESNESTQNKSELEKLNFQFKSMNAFKGEIQEIVTYVESKKDVSTANMVMVFNALPQDVEISSFTINETGFSMQCTGKSLSDANSTVSNLKRIGVNNIVQSAVVKVEEDGSEIHRFQLTGEIGGGKHE